MGGWGEVGIERAAVADLGEVCKKGNLGEGFPFRISC